MGMWKKIKLQGTLYSPASTYSLLIPNDVFRSSDKLQCAIYYAIDGDQVIYIIYIFSIYNYFAVKL